MNICFKVYLVFSSFLFLKGKSEDFSNITNSSSNKFLNTLPTKKSSVFNPLGPKVNCSFLPREFIDCDPPVDHKGNKTARDELGYGCVKFGGYRYEEVEKTRVKCEVLPDIECEGSKIIYRENVPCIRYTGHYFTTILIYSLVLGLVGMDRFCLGHTGTAVGKLLTLGGLGVWWIVDLVMLVTHSLQPEDNSNWNPAV